MRSSPIGEAKNMSKNRIDKRIGTQRCRGSN